MLLNNIQYFTFRFISLILIVFCISGCVSYNHTRTVIPLDQESISNIVEKSPNIQTNKFGTFIVIDKTTLRSFLKTAQASKVSFSTSEDPYSREIDLGGVKSASDTETLKRMLEAGIELGKKSAGLP